MTFSQPALFDRRRDGEKEHGVNWEAAAASLL